jgi:hypothetical protein
MNGHSDKWGSSFSRLVRNHIVRICSSKTAIALVLCVTLRSAAIGAGPSSTIPEELWGKWIIVRELNTRTISCWSEDQAKELIRTEIEYSGVGFRWKDISRSAESVEVKAVSADQFHEENSGKGANSSQVTFEQLAIKAARTKQITIGHPSGGLTATIEIPGDQVLIKGRDTIVFSVCNVYSEARRVSVSTPNKNSH